MIFWGEEDKRFETAIKTLEQGIPGAVLTTIKGVGHSPHQDDPDIFNRELLTFLQRVYPAGKI